MSQATVVRARQKALEDLPEWAKCCEQMCAAYCEVPVLVVYEKVLWTDGKCKFCGHMRPVRPYRKLVEPIGNMTCLWVDCFDFDEGPSQAVTHDH